MPRCGDFGGTTQKKISQYWKQLRSGLKCIGDQKGRKDFNAPPFGIRSAVVSNHFCLAYINGPLVKFWQREEKSHGSQYLRKIAVNRDFTSTVQALTCLLMTMTGNVPSVLQRISCEMCHLRRVSNNTWFDFTMIWTRGSGDPHIKREGMFVVSLRGVNFGFWSHLGCSGQNAIICSREGLL